MKTTSPVAEGLGGSLGSASVITNTKRAKWLREDVVKYARKDDWGMLAYAAAELAKVAERLDAGFEDEKEIKL